MPWCDDCSKFWNPPELKQGQSCPTCGRVLAGPAGAAQAATRPATSAGAKNAGTKSAGAQTAGTKSAGAKSAGAKPGSARPVSVHAGGGEPGTATAVVAEGTAAGAPGTVERAKRAPWHFKLLVVGVTVYMIYRIYWLVEWLPKHI